MFRAKPFSKTERGEGIELENFTGAAVEDQLGLLIRAAPIKEVDHDRHLAILIPRQNTTKTAPANCLLLGAPEDLVHT
jgi:hypothetical protein